MPEKLNIYIKLMRLDKPIGSLLLMWPMLCAMWFAASGRPDIVTVLVFILGTVMMRSAGCIINDYADRDFDRHVERTRDRPLTAGKISVAEALILFVLLCLLSFAMLYALAVWLQKREVLLLAFVAVFLAVSYPFTKRFFPLPQAYLGLAYGFGIPMAYAAVLDQVPVAGWLLLLANVFWSLAYDTEYAMVDREDDLKIGIKTSAITFGSYDVIAVMCCYAAHLGLVAFIAYGFYGRGIFFSLGLLFAVGIAIRHYFWIAKRERMPCFRAFLHNNYLGMAIFIGLVADYMAEFFTG